MSLKTVITAIIFAFLSLSLVPSHAQPAAKPRQKLTVMLDWFVNPDHAALVIAQEKGWFAAQGLDVELQTPADPNDPPKLAAAGKVDLAISYQPQVHIHVNHGLPIKRIATLVATPLNSLVVLKDGPVKNLSDLKGRKIGYSVGGFEEALLKVFLNRAGLTSADVTLVNVNFSLSPALLSGQVDAVIGAFRNFELSQMELVNKPGRAFYPEQVGVPAYDEIVIVASRERLSDPKLRRFISAVEQATLDILNDPDAAWKAFITRHRDLDDELNRRAWRDTLPRLARRPAALDEAGYQRFAQFLVEQGVISKALPVSDYAVQLPFAN